MYGQKNDGVHIASTDISDAAEILALQRVAYQSEARLYEGAIIPPLVQTLSELETEFAEMRFLKAIAGDRLVGSVRGKLVERTCHVGRLIVHPDFQRRGLGSRLMAAIESLFPNVDRFGLFTGHRSEGNLRLYTRLGYRECKREEIHAGLTFVFLEKVTRAAF